MKTTSQAVRRDRWRVVKPMLVVIAALLAAASIGQAQGMAGQTEEVTCNDAMRTEIIDSITTVLNDYYVFPDVAKKMEQAVRKNLKDGKYKEMVTVSQMARALTDDLREVCRDRHLGLRYFPKEELDRMLGDEPTPEQIAQRREEMRKRLARQNFQFKKLEILPGNVGYLKFDQFVDASMAAPTAIAAMNFFAGCDALIIDLRENGGGSPSLIQLITSYFFEEPVHLNSFYIRETDSIKQFWTAASVQGPRLDKTDIYVLTSNYTFSGAEEFSYNLKNLKRGMIVGETTGGGAHPVSEHYFANLNIGIRVPFGRAINPISGTNWEGTGVSPDVDVPADQALDRAYLIALDSLRIKSDGTDMEGQYDWAIQGLKAKLDPVQVDSETLASYAGSYQDRRLWVEDGVLWYQRGDRPKMQALPLTANLFWFEDTDYFRLEVVTDMSGNPTKLIGHYDNGQTDESMRTTDG